VISTTGQVNGNFVKAQAAGDMFTQFFKAGVGETTGTAAQIRRPAGVISHMLGNRQRMQKSIFLALIAAVTWAGTATSQTTAQTTTQKGARSGRPPARRGNGLADKQPDLPAGLFTAESTMARTKIRHEWADVPVGHVKMHVWIEYPDGDGKAPVVVVMPHAAGLTDWARGIADQLAVQGFIAVEPDIVSGLGPNGGNYDSFKFPDDVIKAAARLSSKEAMRRYKAAREYAMHLPRCNGKSASVGFDTGGAYSFQFAAEVPELNAAVVFYGLPPDAAAMAKIKAPVLAFYGEVDPEVTSTVEPTTSAMNHLDKSYEAHVEPGASHAFMMYQVEGENGAAILDAWPRTIAFLNDHTK
jgi:carboxymethylenebutenolidase